MNGAIYLGLMFRFESKSSYIDTPAKSISAHYFCLIQEFFAGAISL